MDNDTDTLREAQDQTVAPAVEAAATDPAPEAAEAPQAEAPQAEPPQVEAPAEPAAPVAEAPAPPAAPAVPEKPKPDPAVLAEQAAKRKAQADEAWAKLVAAKASRELVDGTIRSVVKGGYLLGVGPFRGFLPASQSRLGGIPPEKIPGTKLQVIVLDTDEAKKRVVVSHKQAVEGQRRAARAELLASLQVGAEKTATVVRLADFGAFVDLGGVDALVPISELALERIDKPGDVVKVGDTFQVRILRVDQGGKKIGASRKALLPDPWRDHAALLQRGKVIEGKVVENTSELKIEIAPGVTGTISENEAVPSDYEIGEVVEVSVRSIDYRKRNVRLSTMHATPSFETGSFAPLGAELNKG